MIKFLSKAKQICMRSIMKKINYKNINLYSAFVKMSGFISLADVNFLYYYLKMYSQFF